MWLTSGSDFPVNGIAPRAAVAGFKSPLLTKILAAGSGGAKWRPDEVGSFYAFTFALLIILQPNAEVAQPLVGAVCDYRPIVRRRTTSLSRLL